MKNITIDHINNKFFIETRMVMVILQNNKKIVIPKENQKSKYMSKSLM